MIDLSLMERLVRAVADDARLVLLGDADQLAVDRGRRGLPRSVAAGARLTRSHRMDPTADGRPAAAELARGPSRRRQRAPRSTADRHAAAS